MMERNSRTPALARHYRPAPPLVWLQAFVLVGIGGLAAFVWLVFAR